MMERQRVLIERLEQVTVRYPTQVARRILWDDGMTAKRTCVSLRPSGRRIGTALADQQSSGRRALMPLPQRLDVAKAFLNHFVAVLTHRRQGIFGRRSRVPIVVLFQGGESL